jgi:hypothetical protein
MRMVMPALNTERARIAHIAVDRILASTGPPRRFAAATTIFERAARIATVHEIML